MRHITMTIISFVSLLSSFQLIGFRRIDQVTLDSTITTAVDHDSSDAEV